MTNEWIEWRGGDCPIKSDETRVEYTLRGGHCWVGLGTVASWSHPKSRPNSFDIVKYRIIEDHEPKETKQMTNEWIEWRGGDCPIKSNDTVVGYVLREGFSSTRSGKDLNWSHSEDERSAVADIVKYCIVEDHEPKETKQMTREQILAQIAELEKQLVTMPKCIWVNEHELGNTYYETKESAERWGQSHCIRVAVKYQEVIE